MPKPSTTKVSLSQLDTLLRAMGLPSQTVASMTQLALSGQKFALDSTLMITQDGKSGSVVMTQKFGIALANPGVCPVHGAKTDHCYEMGREHLRELNENQGEYGPKFSVRVRQPRLTNFDDSAGPVEFS